MMEARLGVTTCDKSKEPMKEAQPILIIAGGNVTEWGNGLNFRESYVQYACHLDCWDGVEELTNDGVNLFLKE